MTALYVGVQGVKCLSEALNGRNRLFMRYFLLYAILVYFASLSYGFFHCLDVGVVFVFGIEHWVAGHEV
jgi:hypothetical protein